MARKYLFVCDGGCGTTEQRDSECLPDGWAIITAAGAAVDVCSLACALVRMDRLRIHEAPAPARRQLEG